MIIIKKRLLAKVLAICIAALLLSAIAPVASANTVTVPPGTDEHRFSIEIELTDSRQFAGVHIDLTVSDSAALQLAGFEVTSGGGAPQSVSPVMNGDTYSFGFFTDGNYFQGTYSLRLLLNYSGSADQALTLDRIAFARYSQENPQVSEWMRTLSDYATVNITRSGGDPNVNGGNGGSGNGGTGGSGNSGGGSGAGGGGSADGGDDGGTAGGEPAIVIAIEDEGTPLAENPERSSYFIDVVSRHYWAIEAIDTLYEMGVVRGTSTDPMMYSPDDYIKRGDFMLMIVRAFELEAETDGNFPDVPQGSYYYDAIAIAKTLDIARGYGVDFHPESFISRQEMMAVIDRTLRTIGRPLPQAPLSVLDAFADRDRIADYALESVATLVQSEIIRGDGTRINPLGFTTRAEMAVVIFRITV